jgi:predicted DCC family thiol-disulfide oxidoreductase YuxK
MTELTGKTIVFYDGVCGLCNRLVKFLLRFDRRDRFRYAALQSDFAAEVLSKHGLSAADLNSVTLVRSFGLQGERAYTKSDAIMIAAGELGGFWRVGEVALVLPKGIRDKVYEVIARNRYRMFGRYQTCPVPKPEVRAKFIC